MTINRATALWATRGAIAMGAAALLAACGSTAASSSQTYAQNGSGATRSLGGGRPGASGLVAAVSGETAQVQNAQSGQVAVSWTSSTKFSQEVSTSKSAVTVGACVVVSEPSSSTSSSSSPTVTAASVRVTASTNGTCTPGGGRGAGQGGGAPLGGPSGVPSGIPTNAPSGFGSGGPGGGRGGFGGAFGKVTAVSASGFTVQSSFGGTTRTTTVATTASTTYLTSATATSSAVKVGTCVRANGAADSTGAIKASTISVSQPVGGACSGGFGARG